MMHETPRIQYPPWVEGTLEASHDIDLRTHISPAIKPRFECGGSAFHDQIPPLGGEIPTYLRQRLDEVYWFLALLLQWEAPVDQAIAETGTELSRSVQARPQLGKAVEDRSEVCTDSANPTDHVPHSSLTFEAEPTLQCLPQAPIIWACPVAGGSARLAEGIDLATLPGDSRFSTIDADDKRPPFTPFRAIESPSQPGRERRVDQLHRIRQQSMRQQSLGRFYSSFAIARMSTR